jgi:hypothetical protein
MPDNSDGALEPDQQPTLSLAVAGTMEIPGSEDGIRPPLLMLFMANGEIRWVNPPSDDRQESSE